MGVEQLEYKAVLEDLKADGDKGIYEGHFSVFENVDDGMDVIHEGSFLDTLEERGDRIKVFYAHDWMKLIGPTPDILKEDDEGLYAKGRLSLGTFWGNEVWELMKDGALNEGSIGYRAVDFKWADNGIRHIYKIKLYEISPVPLGMNPLTSVQALKSALGMALPGNVTGNVASDSEGSEDADALDVTLTGFVERFQEMARELREGNLLRTAGADVVVELAGAFEATAEALHAIVETPPEDTPKRSEAQLELQRRLRVSELALQIGGTR
jgi:hypothetical protein